jgi:hypothetical protein
MKTTSSEDECTTNSETPFISHIGYIWQRTMPDKIGLMYKPLPQVVENYTEI